MVNSMEKEDMFTKIKMSTKVNGKKILGMDKVNT
jgi:hypothetical protein